MGGGTSRRGGPHHHFFGGGRVLSVVLANGLAWAAAATADALRLSAAALRALSYGPWGMSRVTLANTTLAAAVPVDCRLTSKVQSTKAWRAHQVGPKPR
jgi:hypothetical protein